MTRGLPLFVISTTSEGTRAALQAAARHAHGLSPQVILMVPQVVGYPDPLTVTDVVRTHAAALAQVARESDLEVSVLGVACRSLTGLAAALPDDALVLVGGRPGRLGWRTAAERLAEIIRRSGRQSLFVPAAWSRPGRPPEATQRD